ncbi:MAG: DUF1934 domain-containing protein [Anaerovoracaceae bacterium]|jgi:uncharacterized beta-barrel protein YwiB (DUF1934 family)
MMRVTDITIKTIIDYENQDREQINECHRGNFYIRDNTQYLEYQETEADTKQPIMTTVSWLNQEPLEITVIRTGAVNAKNVFRQELIDFCRYQTQVGALAIETETESVEVSTNQCGGKLRAAYNLKINGEQVGSYQLTINYKFSE